MDADRFDALARSLTQPRSRRVLTAALGGLLAVTAIPLKAKKKPCPPCKKRKKGKCTKKLPEGTVCGSGKTCQNGSCLTAVTPPFCAVQPAWTPCGSNQFCQGGACLSGTGICSVGADICTTGTCPGATGCQCGGNCLCYTSI